MRYHSIFINKSLALSKGIKSDSLEKLSPIVALVGKNGSGKTRILDLIESALLENITIEAIINETIIYIPEEYKTIAQIIVENKKLFSERHELQSQQEKLGDSQKDIADFNIKATEFNTKYISMHHIHNNVDNQFTTLKHGANNYIRRINYTEIQSLQSAMSDNEILKNVPFADLLEKITQSEYNELRSIHGSALDFLAIFPNKLAAEYFDCKINDLDFKETHVYQRFLSLQNSIESFLKKKLDWYPEKTVSSETKDGVHTISKGIWKLNDRIFNYNELSDGERVLFAYAMLFFLIDQNPKTNIKECIILIDEPELHLHPSSEIELIEGLRNIIGDKGQLIFTTHSINILSTLSFDEILVVKDGAILTSSSAKIKESVTELMNLEERIDRLCKYP